MLKVIKYEGSNIEDMILDLADEIKLGWKVHSFGYPDIEFTYRCNPKTTVEVALTKRDGINV